MATPPGSAWRGKAGLGKAGRGSAWRGEAGLGKARQGLSDCSRGIFILYLGELNVKNVTLELFRVESIHAVPKTVLRNTRT